jgi:hypothetical protein
MKLSKLLLSGALGSILILNLTGCSQRLGQFTAASTQNVRNLNYNISDNTKVKAFGDSCITTVIFFPVGNQDDRIQRAMDDAINNGHSKGLDGDLLVNARIDLTAWYVPFLVGQNCVTVEGDLVKITK